jgi:hypothetical protein
MRRVDNSAQRFDETVEPEWQPAVANPESRWHREIREYANRFRSGKTAGYPARVAATGSGRARA